MYLKKYYYLKVSYDKFIYFNKHSIIYYIKYVQLCIHKIYTIQIIVHKIIQ